MLNPKCVNIIVSQTHDTCVNLAYEEYFMHSVAEDEWILFWWQSDNAVVIGRNQNPYQECNLEAMKADAVKLVRRLSGGGAVYHDLGNLNFSFISKGEVFNPELHFDILLEALAKVGVKGTFTGRNDLTVQGRKFSGNAFIHEEDQHLHHGTILIDSDVDKISNYLMVNHEKLDTKGFDSVKSRVINLKEIVPDITIQIIIEAVTKTIDQKLRCDVHHYQFESSIDADADVYLDKYYSDIWNYGDTPSFSCEMQQRFEWGELHVLMDIQEGVIETTSIVTDALEAEAFSKLTELLCSVPLMPDLVYEQIVKSGLNHHLVKDVYKLISDAIFN